MYWFWSGGGIQSKINDVLSVDTQKMALNISVIFAYKQLKYFDANKYGVLLIWNIDYYDS